MFEVSHKPTSIPVKDLKDGDMAIITENVYGAVKRLVFKTPGGLLVLTRTDGEPCCSIVSNSEWKLFQCRPVKATIVIG